MRRRRYKRVFVLGAYLPAGGAYMAYHVGKIIQEEFGAEGVAVSAAYEVGPSSVHTYDAVFPTISADRLRSEATRDDILVANPSFSNLLLGWQLPCFKLSYVQGFSTFELLDCRFDHYVCASEFVQRFVRSTYGIDANLITPFVDLQSSSQAPPWSSRPSNVILPYRKGIQNVWDISFTRLTEIVDQRAPEILFTEPLAGGSLSHPDFLSCLSNYRYFLTLSAAEGFGLVPLEAMGMECVVFGYDGFGGRQYMVRGGNCATSPYPSIEDVADQLINTIRSPDGGYPLAISAKTTARAFTYDKFRRAWISELASALGTA